MNDKPMAGRVKLLLSRSAVESATAVYPVVSSMTQPLTTVSPAETTPETEPPEPQPATSSPLLPEEALKVLTLAQRTAEEHVAAANEQAARMRAEAEGNAERIRREAEEHAEKVHAEADNMLAATHVAAELTNKDAHAQADEIRREAQQLLADSRAEAERIVAGGKKTAEKLKLQAQRRYEEAVGGLSVKRTALQEQIESLEVFDADYRRRLATFLQSQLRALWADRPEATDVPESEVPEPGGPVTPAEQA